MTFGIFEAAVGSEHEVALAKQASIDKMSAAIYDVRAKLGPMLFASRDVGEFRDKVAMMKSDQSVFKIIQAAGVFPSTGVVRKIVGKGSVLEREFRTHLADNGIPGVAPAPTPTPAPTTAPSGMGMDPTNPTAGGVGAGAAPQQPMAPVSLPGTQATAARTACWPGCHENEAHAKKFHNKDKDKEARRTGVFDEVSKGESPGKAKWNGALDTDQTFEDHQGEELIPKDDWDGYRNKMDQGAPEKVRRNFAFRVYTDWCEAEGRSPLRLSSLDAYASHLPEKQYFHLANCIAACEGMTEHHPKVPNTKLKAKDKVAKGLVDRGFDAVEDAASRGLDRAEKGVGKFLDKHPKLDEMNTKVWNRPAGPIERGFGRMTDKLTGERSAGAHDIEKSVGTSGYQNQRNPYTGKQPTQYEERPQQRDWNGGPTTEGFWPAPDQSGKHRAATLRQYKAWCRKHGLRMISARNINHYAQGNPQLAYALAMEAKQAIRTARRRQGYGSPEGTSDDFNDPHPHSPQAEYQHPGQAEGWKGTFEENPSAYSGESYSKGKAQVRGGPGPDGERYHLQTPHGTAGPYDSSDQAFSKADPYLQSEREIGRGQGTLFGASRRRTAAPDYLQKADDALTQLLNQKAEEFQQTIAPLQQALVTVQQATQLQQAQNPLNVLPPPGTVNVMPGGAGQAGGAPSTADQMGMPDPNAPDLSGLAQMLQPGGGDMGGVAPQDSAPGGGAGPPPAAADPNAQAKAARNRGKGRGAARPRQAAGVGEMWDQWKNQRNDQGDALRGDEVDYARFQQEKGVGDRALNNLRTRNQKPDFAPINGPQQPRQPSGGGVTVGRRRRGNYEDMPDDSPAPIVGRPADSDYHLERGNTNAAWALHKEKQHGKPLSEFSDDDWAIAGEPPRRQGQRKQAWSGWGPAVHPKTRKVAGWDWDDYQNGYMASAPRHFECACGEQFPAPSGFQRCACGRQWNSYVIGTGGAGRNASADKFIVREIPVRPDVIVASKKRSRSQGGEWERDPLDNSGADSFLGHTPDHKIPQYLEHLRGKVQNQNISMGELSDLQGLAGAGYVHPDDMELHEAAGTPEEDFRRGQDRDPDSDPFDPREFGAMRKGAPFAGYDDFASCEQENSDKDRPSAYCGEIKHRTEDKKGSVQLIDPRTGMIHRLIDPGEVGEGEDPGHPTFRKPSHDWAKRMPAKGNPGQWSRSPIG